MKRQALYLAKMFSTLVIASCGTGGARRHVTTPLASASRSSATATLAPAPDAANAADQAGRPVGEVGQLRRPATWGGEPFWPPQRATLEETRAFEKTLQILARESAVPIESGGFERARQNIVVRLSKAKELIDEELPRAFAWDEVRTQLGRLPDQVIVYSDGHDGPVIAGSISINYLFRSDALLVNEDDLERASLEVIAQKLVSVFTAVVEREDQLHISGYTPDEYLAWRRACPDFGRMSAFVSRALSSYNEALWLLAKNERLDNLTKEVVPMSLHEWLLYLQGTYTSSRDLASALWGQSSGLNGRERLRRASSDLEECRFPIKIRVPDQGGPYVVTDVFPDILSELAEEIPH